MWSQVLVTVLIQSLLPILSFLLCLSFFLLLFLNLLHFLHPLLIATLDFQKLPVPFAFLFCQARHYHPADRILKVPTTHASTFQWVCAKVELSEREQRRWRVTPSSAAPAGPELAQAARCVGGICVGGAGLLIALKDVMLRWFFVLCALICSAHTTVELLTVAEGC